MRNINVILGCSLLLISVCTSAQKVFNDALAQERTVGEFTSIEVGNGVDLILTQGASYAIAVSANSPEYRDEIKTVVENGVLKISYSNNKWWKNINNQKPKAYVSFRDINSIKATGASDVLVSGVISTNALQISFSGASDFKGELQVDNLDIKLSGASDANIKGTVNDMSITVSGASDLKGYNLKTNTCRAKASGASEIRITVVKELDADASGASSVYFQGEAVIRNLRSSGASSVSKKG